MPDDTDVEQLLENFKSALETLSRVEDVEGLISKLNAKNNGKLLKKVKTVVREVHKTVNIIKERVSKACRLVGTLSDSDSEADDVQNYHSGERCSPIIGGKGRKLRKLAKQSKNVEVAVQNEVERTVADVEYCNISTIDGAETEKRDDNVEVNDDTTEESDIVENTPEKTSKKKFCLSLRKNLNKDSQNESVIEVLDSTVEVDSIEDGIGNAENETSDLGKSTTEGLDDLSEDSDAGLEQTQTRENESKKSGEKDNDTDKLNDNQDETSDSLVAEDGEHIPHESRTGESGKDKNIDELRHSGDEGESDTTRSEKEIEKGKSRKSGNKTKQSDATEELCESSQGETAESESNRKESATDKDTLCDNSISEAEKSSGKTQSDEGNDHSDKECEKEAEALPLKIKLVDINKLLDPNIKPMEMNPTPTRGRKSVTFDSSIIVLTSSDEDTPKKNPKAKNSTPLKSALRKSPSIVIDLSDEDSDSKENKQNTRSKKNSHKKLLSEHSSDEDSDFDYTAIMLRTRRRDKSIKEKFSPLRQLVNERKSRRKSYEHSSDEDSQKPRRKSRRNKDKTLDSEDESTSGKQNKNTKKKRKKEILEESSLSETSSSSENFEVEAMKSSKSQSKSKRMKSELKVPDINDPKFKLSVLVQLPKFNCEELPELYKRKKEIFEIKKLSKMPVTLRSRQKTPSAKNSDDSDTSKPEKKKMKLDKAKGRKEESSDDERSSTEDIDDKEKNGKKANDSDDEDVSMADLDRLGAASDTNAEMEQLAMACLEQINEDLEQEKDTNIDGEANEPDENTKKKAEKKNVEKGDDNSHEDSADEANENDKNKKKDQVDEESNKEKDSSEEINNSKGKSGEKSKSKDNSADKSSGDEDKEKERADEEPDKEKKQDSDPEGKAKKKSKKKNNAKDDTDTESDSIEDKGVKKKVKKKNKAKDDSDTENDSTEESSKTSGEKNKDKDPLFNGKLSSDSEEDSDGKRKNKRKNKNEASSEEEKGKSKKTISLDSSDSDDDFAKYSKKKDKSRGVLVREAKKRMKKKVISDSESEDESDKEKTKKRDKSDDDFKTDENSSDSSASEDDKDKKEEEKEKSKPARRRIKRVKDDSSSNDDDKSTRKQIRKMIDRDSLSETTKKAEQEEKERKARIAEKQRKYNQIFQLKADATVDKVVLDFNEKTDEPLLSVHKKLVKQLKPHQVQGIKFMWDASFESLDRVKKTEGSGCILAHCMGLGKTLQVIALVHTLLTNQNKTKVEKVLVVCPVNTVINWKNEFKKWMPSRNDFEIYELVSCKTSSINQERNYIVQNWHEDGGVLIIGYNMFRTLSNPDNKSLSKKLRESFNKALVDPGPDLVVCDEGHLLKNEKTNLSIAMNRIKTPRRIVLTGTPLQNNLKEYWCMVQFIKPNLLGTYKEYLNRFVNPIINGQYTDSTQHDIMVMRRRSHVLHKLLDGVVQRQDYAVLEPYLPPKHEYVLFLKLTDVQAKLYQHYLNNFARKGDGSNRTSFLFTDFQQLQRICTHPRVLLDKSMEDRDKKNMKDDESESEGSIKDFIDDDSESASSTGSESGSDSSAKGSGSDASVRSHKKGKKKHKQSPRRTRFTRAQAAQKRENGGASESDDDVLEIRQKEWWDEYINRDELDNINHSAKIFLLFQILKECEEIGDKILVFSQSLYTLNCIEYFLARIDEATQKGDTDKVGGHTGSWALGLDYFRLDGSSSCDNRASWCDQFNDPDNTRARLFLISTKAGGLGINLVAANRVIIFDVSWNPSHDIQSIYRVYRFGQTKPSYIYRFVTYGSMEMKIYERQVTKQAISKRVIDEQQIDRHYSQNDIQELYKTDLEPSDRPIPLVPKDVLLGEMLQKYDKTIFKYHEHQSLLENKQDEELNEEERKAAWDEFENEKVIRKTTITNFAAAQFGAGLTPQMLSPQIIQMALGNIVRKDNPTWSDVQIKGILPALVTQLQMQMSENDYSMYNRVQQEVRIMQAMHAQRMMKQYQLQQMLQKQALANQLMGSMNITPEELRSLQLARATQNYVQPPQGGSGGAPGRSGDVIELND